MNKKMRQHTQESTAESFVKLPRGEFLLQQVRGLSTRSLGDFVRNETLEMTERLPLQVTDDAMVGAGIRAGDYVIVEKGKFAEGDILAVRLGDAVLIRRYYRAANRIRLECDPATRQTLIVEADTPGFAILGRVVQIIREV
ncbi:MAG: hypothetical protein GXO78_00090 [Calditrichaeota bacterium]|nr:hypothetical protein [Calditrichota bacterium]